MKSTQAARALAARRKSHGPKPVRRWRCCGCGETMGTNEMRSHGCYEQGVEVLCLRCDQWMTRSQTRTHRCEEER